MKVELTVVLAATLAACDLGSPREAPAPTPDTAPAQAAVPVATPAPPPLPARVEDALEMQLLEIYSRYSASRSGEPQGDTILRMRFTNKAAPIKNVAGRLVFKFCSNPKAYETGCQRADQDFAYYALDLAFASGDCIAGTGLGAGQTCEYLARVNWRGFDASAYKISAAIPANRGHWSTKSIEYDDGRSLVAPAVPEAKVIHEAKTATIPRN